MRTISDHLLPYRAFLMEEQQRITAEICRLEQQNRQDEANLQKIRLNIVTVFETVAAADEKQTATWEAFCQRYEPRFATLTAPWSTRLAAAREHGDLHTQVVEEAKLETANHIKDVFISTKE